MSDHPLVLLEGVAKIYGEAVKTRALHDVNVRIEGGELVALAGPSGSGKSTLLNLLGLLDRPTSGRIVLGGVDTTGKSDRELTELRAKLLGFVFQFHHLLPAFNAVENVMLPAWGHTGRPSAEARQRAEELLRLVGLGHRLDRRPNQLSGGEQQRVAIARALVHEPPLVLADEPTGNLDVSSSNDVFALVRRINRERGTTFLVVTHDPSIAARCDRVLKMIDGRLEDVRPS
ncbi:MAG TPA: ABC transporter ATP-binding protein [Polyangia bacterium]